MQQQQHTLEWYKARLGRPTASQMWRVMARRKDGKISQTRASYIAELVTARRVTSSFLGYALGPFSPALQWGIDHEDAARDRYVAETGNTVEPVGFIEHPMLY